MTSRMTFSLFILLLFLYTSCGEEKVNDIKIYSFLEVCYEDYYLNYDVKIKEELDQFEQHLINEGHLKDSSGSSYKQLLNFLSRENYFKPPLKFDAFNNTVLYKVPDDLIGCTQSIFGIDSSLVKKTSYFSAQQKIRAEIAKSEEISINQLFRYNSDFLSDETITAPFVKQSILQLLYRWYFKSKYDREIPLTEDNLVKPDSSAVQ